MGRQRSDRTRLQLRAGLYLIHGRMRAAIWRG